MHIILLILKIIGIVLFSLIGVILALILLGLFVPLQYNIKGEKKNEKPLGADVHVNWLFHIVSFTLKYKEKVSYRLRILGFTVLKGEEAFSPEENNLSKENKQQGKANKKTKKKQKSAKQEVNYQKELSLDAKRSKGTVSQIALKDKDAQISLSKPIKKDEEAVAENKTQKIASGQEINETKTGKTRIDRFWKHICCFFIDGWNKAKELFYKTKQFCIDLYKKKQQAFITFGIIKDFLNAKENKAGMSALWKLSKKVIKHCKPKKWDYTVRFGTDNPARTGQVLGIVSGVGGVIGVMPNVIPEFHKEVLEGNFFLKGRLQVYYLIWVVVELWRNENFHMLKRNFEEIRRNL